MSSVLFILVSGGCFNCCQAAKQKREETEARLNKKFEEEKNLSIEEKVGGSFDKMGDISTW